MKYDPPQCQRSITAYARGPPNQDLHARIAHFKVAHYPRPRVRRTPARRCRDRLAAEPPGYTNVGIMNGDGQNSVPEATVLGGKLKAGLAFLAGAGGGPLWICTLPRSGRQKARAGQAPQRLRFRRCPGGCRGLGSEHVSSRLHRTVRGRGVRAAHISKEVQARSRHAQGGYRSDPPASQGGEADGKGAIPMKKQRVVRGIPIEQGSGNVYADLGYADSEGMLVKAQLAAKIAEIVHRRALTQTRTAEILGLT